MFSLLLPKMDVCGAALLWRERRVVGRDMAREGVMERGDTKREDLLEIFASGEKPVTQVDLGYVPQGMTVEWEPKAKKGEVGERKKYVFGGVKNNCVVLKGEHGLEFTLSSTASKEAFVKMNEGALRKELGKQRGKFLQSEARLVKQAQWKAEDAKKTEEKRMSAVVDMVRQYAQGALKSVGTAGTVALSLAACDTAAGPQRHFTYAQNPDGTERFVHAGETAASLPAGVGFGKMDGGRMEQHGSVAERELILKNLAHFAHIKKGEPVFWRIGNLDGVTEMDVWVFKGISEGGDIVLQDHAGIERRIMLAASKAAFFAANEKSVVEVAAAQKKPGAVLLTPADRAVAFAALTNAHAAVAPAVLGVGMPTVMVPREATRITRDAQAAARMPQTDAAGRKIEGATGGAHERGMDILGYKVYLDPSGLLHVGSETFLLEGGVGIGATKGKWSPEIQGAIVQLLMEKKAAIVASGTISHHGDSKVMGSFQYKFGPQATGSVGFEHIWTPHAAGNYDGVDYAANTQNTDIAAANFAYTFEKPLNLVEALNAKLSRLGVKLVVSHTDNKNLGSNMRANSDNSVLSFVEIAREGQTTASLNVSPDIQVGDRLTVGPDFQIGMRKWNGVLGRKGEVATFFGGGLHAAYKITAEITASARATHTTDGFNTVGVGVDYRPQDSQWGMGVSWEHSESSRYGNNNSDRFMVRGTYRFGEKYESAVPEVLYPRSPAEEQAAKAAVQKKAGELTTEEALGNHRNLITAADEAQAKLNRMVAKETVLHAPSLSVVFAVLPTDIATLLAGGYTIATVTISNNDPNSTGSSTSSAVRIGTVTHPSSTQTVFTLVAGSAADMAGWNGQVDITGIVTDPRHTLTPTLSAQNPAALAQLKTEVGQAQEMTKLAQAGVTVDTPGSHTAKAPSVSADQAGSAVTGYDPATMEIRVGANGTWSSPSTSTLHNTIVGARSVAATDIYVRVKATVAAGITVAASSAVDAHFDMTVATDHASIITAPTLASVTDRTATVTPGTLTDIDGVQNVTVKLYSDAAGTTLVAAAVNGAFTGLTASTHYYAREEGQAKNNTTGLFEDKHSAMVDVYTRPAAPSGLSAHNYNLDGFNPVTMKASFDGVTYNTYTQAALDTAVITAAVNGGVPLYIETAAAGSLPDSMPATVNFAQIPLPNVTATGNLNIGGGPQPFSVTFDNPVHVTDDAAITIGGTSHVNLIGGKVATINTNDGSTIILNVDPTAMSNDGQTWWINVPVVTRIDNGVVQVNTTRSLMAVAGYLNF